MSDDLDQFRNTFHQAIIRGDLQTVSDDLETLLITIRQLRREKAEMDERLERVEVDAADLRRSMVIMQDDHRRVLSLLSAAEADAAALREYADHTPGCPLWNDLRGICNCGFSAVAGTEHPGASLLAEADAAALRDILIRGLGLANELGEGERWADWRLQAHTILNRWKARGE